MLSTLLAKWRKAEKNATNDDDEERDEMKVFSQFLFCLAND